MVNVFSNADFCPMIVRHASSTGGHDPMAGTVYLTQQLSPDECRLLQLASLGRSGAQMADELDRPLLMIAAHLAAIRQRLGVSSTAQAVVVRRRGLLPSQA